MNWWRAHHGISHDPKLALIAKRAKVKKCEVLAVWVSLLDYASQQQDRGHVSGIDYEEVAFQTDIQVDTVHRIVSQFREKKMLEGVRLSAWEKRQYGDSSAGRMKRFRERKALTPKSDAVNVTVTDVTEHVTAKRHGDAQIQNRTDTEQTTTEPQPSHAVTIEFPKSTEFIRRKFPSTDDSMVRAIVDRAVQEVIGAGEAPELVTDEVLLTALAECTTKKQYNAALYLQTVGTWMRNKATTEAYE